MKLLTRRDFLCGAAAMAAFPMGACVASPVRTSATVVSLRAAPAQVPLVGAPHPPTDVWCYNGRVPGPEIRVRQGSRLRVEVANALSETTTVHWHGVRVPHAMDGVPHISQEPIAAEGGTFTYEFDVPDAGTFWYHPHSRSYEQVDRGLSGVIVVEETKPAEVDRDVTWVLDDWRLKADASVSDDFISFFDNTHAGRIGNTVTVNGAIPETFALRAGERIRLRLLNVANARSFGLRFSGHRPWIVAYDGHPVEPHEPARGIVVVGSSQRVDLILDATGERASRHAVQDVFYPRQAYRLLDLAYADEGVMRSGARGAPMRLPDNPLPEPELATAVKHEIRMSGGMMSRNWPDDPLPARAARHMRRWFGAREADPAWAINGVAITEDHSHSPVATVRRDQSVILDFRNDTAWPHPMHLHGHAFRVIARDGKPTPHREWRDTVLVGARENATVAFVADNPGDWMLHCHVLEHQAAGMMALLRVE